MEILEEGGNAFDSAIAVSSVLSVFQPNLGGLGGDGFLLAFYGDDVIVYNGSGKSPSKFDAKRYMMENPLEAL